MDLGDILAAANSLKVAGQLAVGLIDLKTMSEVHAKAAQLNREILAAQHELFAANAAQTALVNEVRELKEQIARMENWDAQKKRYKLVTIFSGSFTYALQKSMSDGEPAHYICTNCYESGKRSILQGAVKLTPGAGVRACFECPVCETEVNSGFRLSDARYAEDIAGG